MANSTNPVAFTKAERLQCQKLGTDPVHYMCMKIRKTLAKGDTVSAAPPTAAELKIARVLVRGY